MSEPVYDLRGHYAGFVSRLTAFLIDHAIIYAIIATVMAVSTYLFEIVGLSIHACEPAYSFEGAACLMVQAGLGLFAFGFAPFYTILFWTLAAQTPGKYIMGLRIYRMNGDRLTLKRAIRRYVGYILSFLAFGLGFLWIIIDDERQGFHDIFADTCVVYAWDAFQNQRLINRLSMKLYRGHFFENPDAFYARGMTHEDAGGEEQDAS